MFIEFQSLVYVSAKEKKYVYYAGHETISVLKLKYLNSFLERYRFARLDSNSRGVCVCVCVGVHWLENINIFQLGIVH